MVENQAVRVTNSAVKVTDNGAVTSGRVVDDFERANLNPYSYVGGFSIAGSPASQGTYSLQSDGNSGNMSIVSYQGDGLRYYPTRGDTIKFDIRFNSTGGKLMFGFFHGPGGPLNDSYEVDINNSSGAWGIFNDKGDQNRVNLQTDSIPQRTDTWETVEIDTHGGGIDLTFRGSTLSTGDTARSSGGIGFFTDGVRGWFDNVRAI